MALRASPGIVLRQVLIVGITPVVFGVAAGSVAAMGASRLISGILYGVPASDVVSFSVSALALLIAGAAAAFLPALRAGHTNPVEALRGVVN